MLDESTVSQLCEMGFPLEACKKAVYYTGNTGIDAAMNWVMGHMDDAGKSINVSEIASLKHFIPGSINQPHFSDWVHMFDCRFCLSVGVAWL